MIRIERCELDAHGHVVFQVRVPSGERRSVGLCVPALEHAGFAPRMGQIALFTALAFGPELPFPTAGAER